MTDRPLTLVRDGDDFDDDFDDMKLPVDPDVALITDYLTGQLSEREAERVEDRIADDAEFYEKVSPVIGMYTSDLDFPRMVAEAEQREASEAREASPPARVQPWLRRYHRALVAASLLLMVGLSGGVGFAYAAGASEAAAIAALEPTASSDRVGTFVYAPKGERLWIDLAGGSRLRLEPGSRVTYRRRTQWPGGFLVTLKGEAFIDVSDADGVMFVATAHGTAVLLAGTYGIRCRLGCEEVEVAVGARGVAWLHGRGTEWTYWPVRAGGFAESMFGIGFVKTTGVGYPLTR